MITIPQIIRSTFFLILLLSALRMNAQSHPVEISLQQDFRLLTVGDDKGNDPLTLNVLSRIEVPIKNYEKSHFAAYFSAEYADLKSRKYTRYALGGGYVIDEFSGKFGVGAYLDYGRIYRDNNFFNSFSLSGELNFKLNDRFKIICTQQLKHRKDLKMTYGCREFVISGFVGLKYAI